MECTNCGNEIGEDEAHVHIDCVGNTEYDRFFIFCSKCSESVQVKLHQWDYEKDIPKVTASAYILPLLFNEICLAEECRKLQKELNYYKG